MPNTLPHSINETYMPLAGENATLYHVEMDVIQRTWYGFSYHIWADLDIEWCKSVGRTILFVFRDVLNLMNLEYLITTNQIIHKLQQR